MPDALPHALVGAATAAAAFMAVIEVGLAGLALWRNRWHYPRRLRPHFDRTWLPRCAIIIPTKGVPPNFAENSAALLALDYPDYDVYFAVEATDDPGVPLLEELVRYHPRAHLIVAGWATRGCQQNHNMLAGVTAAGDVDVVAFCDNDIAPPRDWLRLLVAPLADSSITVSTGYRWLCGRRGTFAEHVHTLMNMTLYAHFCASIHFAQKGLWGGTFALRRSDFEKLDVAPRWAETVSDDMSLMEILARHHRKSMLVGELLIASDDLFEDTASCVTWYRRQLLNFKAHERFLWATALGFPMCATAILSCWPVVALILTVAFGGSFFSWGGGAGLVQWAGDMLIVALYGLLGPTRKHGLMILRAPLIRAPQLLAYLRTIGADSFVWSKIFYRFNRRGQVVELRRL